MCYSFITVYPAIKGFNNCTQWRELPMCPLSKTLSFPNCDQTALLTFLMPVSTYCSQDCSKVCQSLITGIRNTGCLRGSVGDWITKFWLPKYPILLPVMRLVNLCQPVTSTPAFITSSISNVTSASTSRNEGQRMISFHTTTLCLPLLSTLAVALLATVIWTLNSQIFSVWRT